MLKQTGGPITVVAKDYICNICKIDVAGTALFQITERTKTKFEIKEASGDAINSGTYTVVARII